MSDEQIPDVEDIKSRLGDEIPVDEEPFEWKAATEETDVVDELQNLGRQLGETLRSAWNSEERNQFESELREGVNSFVNEVDNAFSDLRESQAGQKAQEDTSKMRSDIGSAELSEKARSSIASGLHWLSSGLGNLADQFTPVEKAPDEPSSSESEEN